MGMLERVRGAIAAAAVALVAAGCATAPRATPISGPNRSRNGVTAPTTTTVPTPTGPVVTASQLARTFGVVALVRPRAVGDLVLESTTDFVHWRAITPPVPDQGQYGGSAAIIDVSFLDATHGWVVVRLPDSACALYRTRDGGVSWQDLGATTSGGSLGEELVGFVDPDDGWRVAVAPTAGRVSLSTTVDGGSTWAPITDPGRWPSEGLLRFWSPTAGVWADTLPPSPSLVTGQGISQFPRLQVTTDGGRTWRPATVDLPAGYAGAQQYDGLPSLTPAGTGVLPVVLFDRGSETIAFFRTSDGGSSWSYRSSLALGPTANLPADALASHLPAVAAVDQHTWWVIHGTGPLAAPVVQVTRDGGATWSTVSSWSLPYPGIGELQATSAGRAWLRMENGPGCGLYGTDDGGVTWAPVCPG